MSSFDIYSPLSDALQRHYVRQLSTGFWLASGILSVGFVFYAFSREGGYSLAFYFWGMLLPLLLLAWVLAALGGALRWPLLGRLARRPSGTWRLTLGAGLLFEGCVALAAFVCWVLWSEHTLAHLSILLVVSQLISLPWLVSELWSVRRLSQELAPRLVVSPPSYCGAPPTSS